MNFMIGCSSGSLYNVGQVIYSNPDNNEETFTVCKWDNSLSGKTLILYGAYYNITYRIKLNISDGSNGLIGSYFDNSENYTTVSIISRVVSITFRVVSSYLVCDNQYSYENPANEEYFDGPIQITKITIVE